MNRKISRNEKHKYSEEENLVLVENENKRSNKKLKIPVFSNPLLFQSPERVVFDILSNQPYFSAPPSIRNLRVAWFFCVSKMDVNLSRQVVFCTPRRPANMNKGLQNECFTGKFPKLSLMDGCFKTSNNFFL